MALLPLCHIAERLIGEYVSILRCSSLNFIENPETVFDNLRDVQPVVFFAVPRVWEKVFSTVAIAITEAGAIQKAAYGWALGEGMKMVAHAEAGTTPS